MLLHGLALGNGDNVVKMMSYGGVKATPETAVNPLLYGHEYERSLRTGIGLPPSPKANQLGHQFVPSPPLLLSGLMESKLLLPPPPPPPRRLLL